MAGTNPDHEVSDVRRSTFSNINVERNARAHIGDSIQHLTISVGQKPRVSSDPPSTFGLCLGQAPYISPELFIGRDADIEQMREILLPQERSTEQRRLVLGGMGGVGKTQTAIAYAQRYRDAYDSVFWLNATSEVTLTTSFKTIAQAVFEAEIYQDSGVKQIVVQVQRWLSKHGRWLLIYDNYDDPEAYDILTYYPYTSHGSMIITTRLPDQVGGQQVHLRPLNDISHCLAILETRSHRQHLELDQYASRLATRLAGLPLALATAGAFLHRSTWTFEHYLNEYETRWNIIPRRSILLQEYRDRTLYTTWDLSYSRLEKQHPEAAQLLKLLAYFDHQAIWYALLSNVVRNEMPDWLTPIMQNANDFEDSLQVLAEHCFLEVKPSSATFSMHACVHDWTLGRLNENMEPSNYWYAFDCIANSLDKIQPSNLRLHIYCILVPHAVRLLHPAFETILQDITDERMDSAIFVAELLMKQYECSRAKSFLQLLLRRCERVHGANHLSTAEVLRTLAFLCVIQTDFEEAERMDERVIMIRESLLGADNRSTLTAIQDLATVYQQQGRLLEAEEMYLRARNGLCPQTGAEDLSVLNIDDNLGDLYVDLHKLNEAETRYLQAFAGREKALGRDHILTLQTAQKLGTLYLRQSKPTEAEEMLERAVLGQEANLGPTNPTTTEARCRLGQVYIQQGRTQLVEATYAQVLTACRNSSAKEESQRSCFFLSELLYLGIRQQAGGQIAKSGLAHLILLTEEFGKENATVLEYLCRGLLSVGDVTNASLAYPFTPMESRNSRVWRVFCDGCHTRLAIANGRHVCLECINIDLCNKCMLSYASGTLAPGDSCHEHKYFDVGSVVSEALSSTETQNKITIDILLEKLKKEYCE